MLFEWNMLRNSLELLAAERSWKILLRVFTLTERCMLGKQRHPAAWNVLSQRLPLDILLIFYINQESPRQANDTHMQPISKLPSALRCGYDVLSTGCLNSEAEVSGLVDSCSAAVKKRLHLIFSCYWGRAVGLLTFRAVTLENTLKLHLHSVTSSSTFRTKGCRSLPGVRWQNELHGLQNSNNK